MSVAAARQLAPGPPLELLNRVDRAVRASEGARQRRDAWVFRCPAHQDENPSAEWNAGKGVWICRACGAGGGTVDLAGRLGLEAERSQPRETVYQVRDLAGNVEAEHVRVEQPDGSKRYVWRLPGGTNGLGGRAVASLPLYGAHKLRSFDRGRPVFLAEGEKAADALAAAGCQSLGTVTGASSCPRREALAVLDGFDLVVMPDADAPGREHGRKLAEGLAGIARSVRTWAPAGLPDGGDAVEWLAAHPGATAADVERAALAEGNGTERANPHGTEAEPPREPVPGPRLRTLGAILADPAEMRPPVEVVPRLVYSGTVTLLAAREKLGKSRLSTEGAAAVAAGRPFLGRASLAGRVLYVLTWGEEATGHLARHLDAARAPHDLLVLDQVRQPVDVAEALRAHRPALAVVDSLTGIAGEVSDQSSPEGWADVICPLTAAVRETGTGLLIIHHGNRSEGTYRGSSAIGALVDVIAELVAVDGDDTARDVRIRGRVPVENFRYRLAAGGGFELDDPEQAESIEARVLRALADGRPASRNEIVKRAKANRGAILEAIVGMLAAGVLTEREGLIVANQHGTGAEPVRNQPGTSTGTGGGSAGVPLRGNPPAGTTLPPIPQWAET